jgi:hypothetical protein
MTDHISTDDVEKRKKEVNTRIRKSIEYEKTSQSHQQPSEKKGIHKLYKIENVVYLGEKLWRIVDPVTNELIPPELFPYDLRIINRSVYASIPEKTIQIINARKIAQTLHDQNRSSDI